MQITVVPSRQVIKASQGETLLDACRRAGEPISYSCLEGQCGLCRCYLATPDFAGGMLGRDALPKMRECLACQTPLQSGGLVEIPDANDPVVLPAQSSKGRVEALEPLLADVTRASVVLDKPLQYLGGQHFEIAFGPKVKRYYSPTSSFILTASFRSTSGMRWPSGTLFVCGDRSDAVTSEEKTHQKFCWFPAERAWGR